MTDELPSTTAEELWALEFALIVPDGREAEVLERHIATDFHEFGASGQRLSYDDALAVVRGRASAPSGDNLADLTRVSAVLLAADVALLTYRLSTPERRTLRSSIWRRNDHRWVMVFHQGTIIPDEVMP